MKKVLKPFILMAVGFYIGLCLSIIYFGSTINPSWLAALLLFVASIILLILGFVKGRKGLFVSGTIVGFVGFAWFLSISVLWYITHKQPDDESFKILSDLFKLIISFASFGLFLVGFIIVFSTKSYKELKPREKKPAVVKQKKPKIESAPISEEPTINEEPLKEIDEKDLGLDRICKNILTNILFSFAYEEPHKYKNYRGRRYLDVCKIPEVLLSHEDKEFLAKFEAWSNEYETNRIHYGYTSKGVVNTVIDSFEGKAYVDIMGFLHDTGYLDSHGMNVDRYCYEELPEYKNVIGFIKNFYTYKETEVSRRRCITFYKGPFLHELESQFSRLINNVCKGKLVSTKIGFSEPTGFGVKTKRSADSFAYDPISNKKDEDNIFEFGTIYRDVRDRKGENGYGSKLMIYDGAKHKQTECDSIIVIFEFEYNDLDEPSMPHDGPLDNNKFARAAKRELDRYYEESK